MEGAREYGGGGGGRPSYDNVLDERMVERVEDRDKDFKFQVIENRRGRAVKIRELGGIDRVLIIPAGQVEAFVKALQAASAAL